MATTSPARIDDDLYASAKLAGEVQSRSASQQVAHWARIGREIEASTDISHREIAEVLSGSRSYDHLNAKAQAVVRAEWSSRMEAFRSSLDLAREFAAEGRSWVELDDRGAVVERAVAASPRAPKRKQAARAKAQGATAGKAAGTAATGRQAKPRVRRPGAGSTG